jgi:hypothetical protein
LGRRAIGRGKRNRSSQGRVEIQIGFGHDAIKDNLN